MVTIINHDIRSVDGGTVYMPEYIGGEVGWGNLAIPDPYVTSSVQHYPRGTMFRKGDRSWVHTKVSSTTNTGGYGGFSAVSATGLGMFSEAQDSATKTIDSGGGVKGEYTLTVTDTLTANEFAGGLLTIYEADKPIVCVRIISNTIKVITIDGKLPDTYTSSSTNVFVIKSPYRNVIRAGSAQNAAGVYDYCPGIFNSPLDENGNAAAADDFVWLQTWGLCYTQASGTFEGSEEGERMMIVMGGGGTQIMVSANSRMNYQVVGYLYPGTGNTAVANNPSLSNGTDVGMMTHITYLTIRQ